MFYTLSDECETDWGQISTTLSNPILVTVTAAKLRANSKPSDFLLSLNTLPLSFVDTVSGEDLMSSGASP
jgi:hypothetical protein